MSLAIPLQVNLVLNEGKSLGLMIRGGAEYSLGIYITGVDKGSEAESTGLKVRVIPERVGGDTGACPGGFGMSPDLPGQLFRALPASVQKAEVLRGNFLCYSLRPLLHLLARAPRKTLGTFRYFYVLMRSPLSLVFPRLNRPSSRSLSS